MNQIALAGFRGQVAPASLGRLAGPDRYSISPYAPAGYERLIPGYPYGMRGFGQDPSSAMVPAGPMPTPDYPPAPVPQGLPAQSYWQLPPYFSHTYGYKDALAAAGLEFHTEIFDLGIDPVAQSGATIAAGATVIATVRISQEADFVAEKLVSIVRAEAGAPTFSLQIFDNATNRALANIALDSTLITGTAQLPRLMKPRLFRRNSDISFVFTNTGGVTITFLQVVASGFKIFDPNALNLNNPQ